jgi:hypothetical protein
MAAAGYIIAGFALCLALVLAKDHFWSFRAQTLSDYANEAPAFDIRTSLHGDFLADGVIYDYSGRVNARFKANITGNFNETGGVMDEEFIYAGMDEPQRRQWRITYTGPNTFTAEADDIEGTALGEAAGNALRFTYRLELPERLGGHVLDVVDWLYLMDDGTIVNRSDMRKYGVRAAELIAIFHRTET